MTIYKGLKGKTIQNFTSDPSDDTEGQVWYNTTAGAFKSVLSSGTWSSGSPLITARRSLAGAGTQIAGLAFGGDTGTLSSATEEYNGSGWASGGNLGTARYGAGNAGSQTAGLAFGGLIPPGNTAATEEYTGTTFSNVKITTS